MKDVTAYTSLIMSQYQNSPKFLAWVKANVQVLLDISNAATLMKYQFGVDPRSYAAMAKGIAADLGMPLSTETSAIIGAVSFATGVQLDTLGVIIGQPRTMSFQPTGGVNPVLTDETYRTLLFAKIGMNYWDGRIGSLEPLWKRIFPTGKMTVQDNLDMTMTVTLWGGFSSIIEDLITHGLIVPRPEGVLINYLYGTTPFFGCDLDTAYIAGADKGHAV